MQHFQSACADWSAADLGDPISVPLLLRRPWPWKLRRCSHAQTGSHLIPPEDGQEKLALVLGEAKRVKHLDDGSIRGIFSPYWRLCSE